MEAMHARLDEISRRRDELLRFMSARPQREGDHLARLALDNIMHVMHAYDGSVPNVRCVQACIELAETDLRIAEELLSDELVEAGL